MIMMCYRLMDGHSLVLFISLLQLKTLNIKHQNEAFLNELMIFLLTDGIPYKTSAGAQMQK